MLVIYIKEPIFPPRTRSVYLSPPFLEPEKSPDDWRCGRCLKSLSSWRNLQAHVRQVHKFGWKPEQKDANKRISSNEVGRTQECEGVTSIRAASDLRHVGSDVQRVQCPLCSEDFKERWILLKHYICVHLKSQLDRILGGSANSTSCKFCRLTLSCRRALYTHVVNVHSSTKEVANIRASIPLVCFAEAGALQSHQVTEDRVLDETKDSGKPDVEVNRQLQLDETSGRSSTLKHPNPPQ